MADTSRWWGLGRVFLVAMGVVAAPLVTASEAGATSDGASPHLVTVSQKACVPKWSAPPSGQSIFIVRSLATKAIYTVELVNKATGAVFGEVAALAPLTEATMDVALPPGIYEFDCLTTTGRSMSSRSEKVSGPQVPGAHPYRPVSAQQAHQAVQAYRAGAAPWLKKLKTGAASLVAAIKAHQLPRARLLWLSAYLDCERLGAIYTSFMAFSQQVDESPLGLEGGVSSPYFAGFLRLEYGLWHGQTAAELLAPARALYQSVTELLEQFAEATITVEDLASSTQANLEEGFQLELSGRLDEGSHTNLASAWAKVEGAEMTVDALSPLLRESDPSFVPQLQHTLARTAIDLQAHRLASGAWEPAQHLTFPQREALDGQFDTLLEEAAGLPGRVQAPPSSREKGS